MPVIIDENNKIVIVVPPKNGCSTARLTFGKSIGLNKMDDINVCLGNLYIKHKHDNKYIKEYKIYFICRNIEERFVSFVSNVLYNRITSPNDFTESKWKIYLEEYKKFSSVDISLETDINSVLEYQKHIILNKIKNIDDHGFSQLSFMDIFLHDFPIFTYNDFNIISINNLKNILSEYYGSNYSNKNVNVNKEKNNNEIEKKYTINRISNLIYKNQLTTNEKNKIHELYREDKIFEKYNNNDYIINLKQKYPFLHRYKDETITILNIYADNVTFNKLSEFNPKTYSELYPDLKKNMVNCNDDTLIIHYISKGQFEGLRIN